MLDARLPDFVSNGPAISQFGTKKYLWGNVPAFDILQPPQNEGECYEGDLHMLFAGKEYHGRHVCECAEYYVASDDLRNVVKTVISVPPTYVGTISLVINDRDFDIVARNVILILIAMTVADEKKASQCMLHTWYSALIRESDLEILKYFVLPLFEDVNAKIIDKTSTSLFRKTWKFGTYEVSLALSVKSWKTLALYCTPPEDLTATQASTIRAAVTMADVRKDYRERNLFAQKPTDRLCQMKFLEDGILLPFGHSGVDFTVPNPCVATSPIS